MYWETLNFTKSKPEVKKIFGVMYGEEVRIKAVTIQHGIPPHIIGNKIFIGVDPGVHYGVTYITRKGLTVLWGTLPKLSNFVGFEARTVGYAVANLCGLYDALPQGYDFDDRYLYVEGPAFSAQFGQTKLEQARFGFVLGFEEAVNKDHIKYIAPASARKIAFGDGKKAGKDIWININENGADSIGVALACLIENTLS